MTVSIRYGILFVFITNLIAAAYLGFASIHLKFEKLIHFTVFAIITVEFYFIWDTQYKLLKMIRYLTFITCTICGSIGSEILQNLINPNRVFDVYDILFNILGSTCGLIVSMLYSNFRRQQMKNEKKNMHIRIGDVTEVVVNGDKDLDGNDLEGERSHRIESGNLNLELNDFGKSKNQQIQY